MLQKGENIEEKKGKNNLRDFCTAVLVQHMDMLVDHSEFTIRKKPHEAGSYKDQKIQAKVWISAKIIIIVVNALKCDKIQAKAQTIWKQAENGLEKATKF